MSKLDEIITPSAYGFEQYHDSACPECMFDFKEARQQVKALFLEVVDSLEVDEGEVFVLNPNQQGVFKRKKIVWTGKLREKIKDL